MLKKINIGQEEEKCARKRQLTTKNVTQRFSEFN